jgi:uncharacterized protein (DUF2342 family)
VCAQAPDKEDAPAFNDWGARTFLIEVEPLVQKHTGWKLPDFPKFKLVTREQYVAATIEEWRRVLPPGEMPTGAVAKGLEARLRRHAAGLVGAYRPSSKTIFLLPGNLKPIMRDLNVPHYFTRDLVEIVCAHEMTHAFQDAKYPFQERMAKLPDKEAREAYAMLTEGHAMFVQDRVAQDLKVSEAARTMAEELSAREAMNIKSSGDSEATVARRYTAGRRFVEAVFKKGGITAVQRLFDHPPKSPAAVLDPEVFFAMEEVEKPGAPPSSTPKSR